MDTGIAENFLSREKRHDVVWYPAASLPTVVLNVPLIHQLYEAYIGSSALVFQEMTCAYRYDTPWTWE